MNIEPTQKDKAKAKFQTRSVMGANGGTPNLLR